MGLILPASLADLLHKTGSRGGDGGGDGNGDGSGSDGGTISNKRKTSTTGGGEGAGALRYAPDSPVA